MYVTSSSNILTSPSSTTSSTSSSSTSASTSTTSSVAVSVTSISPISVPIVFSSLASLNTPIYYIISSLTEVKGYSAVTIETAEIKALSKASIAFINSKLT